MDERKVDGGTMRRVHARLERGGLLLAHDGALASVSALVAGEPVPGSWWSHPLAHPIYDAMQALDHDHGGDALRVKLLRRKVTFVHRRLWPALFAVASARDAWQTSGLSPQARRLLAQVEDAGLVRMDALPRIKPVATAARDLERRLLVLGDEIHTETGAHAKVLESWAHAHERLRLPRSRPSSADGRRDLEAAAAALGPDGVGALPWSPRSGPSSRARGRGS